MARDRQATDIAAPHPYNQISDWLQPLFRWSGYAAGFCIFGIFAVTMFQIIGRFIGYNPLGLTSYASYLMAASVFFGLSHALDTGSHIRIEMFLSFAGRLRPAIERFGFLAALVIAGWMAYYAWDMVYWSWTLGDISEEMDATPVWIPQMSMALGLSLFVLSILDRALRLLFTGDHGLAPAPDAL